MVLLLVLHHQPERGWLLQHTVRAPRVPATVCAHADIKRMTSAVRGCPLASSGDLDGALTKSGGRRCYLCYAPPACSVDVLVLCRWKDDANNTDIVYASSVLTPPRVSLSSLPSPLYY